MLLLAACVCGCCAREEWDSSCCGGCGCAVLTGFCLRLADSCLLKFAPFAGTDFPRMLLDAVWTRDLAGDFEEDFFLEVVVGGVGRGGGDDVVSRAALTASGSGRVCSIYERGFG